MAVRLTLQFTAERSHALIVCTPWIRLLVETESLTGRGHVIGKELRLRKTINGLNVITDIDMEQMNPHTERAQMYVDHCEWWLHRAPFGVERLPVRLTVRNVVGPPIHVCGWRVTTLQLSKGTVPVDLGIVKGHFPDVVNLNLCNTAVSCLDLLSDLQHLEELDVSCCRDLCDLGPLGCCSQLKALHIWGTGVLDLGPLSALTQLERLDADGCQKLHDLRALARCHSLKWLSIRNTSVATLEPLSGLECLEYLSVMGCSHVRDLNPLRGCVRLRHLNVDNSGVSSLDPLERATRLEMLTAYECDSLASVEALRNCHWLMELRLSGTNVSDLSPLAGLPSLEILAANRTPAATLTGLGTCSSLKEVTFAECRSLHDLSPLAGAPNLE